MTLYETIFKRKSTRKYDIAPLSEKEIAEITEYAENLRPLFSEIKVKYHITSEAKNLLPVKAPYYLIITSEEKDGYLENIGFMFQQMDLFLQSKGYGSCWLGMAKPTADLDTDLPFVIAMCFGKSKESPYREIIEFKRKKLSLVSSGSDERLLAAALAPSATNSQNWFFKIDGSIGIQCFQKKVNPIATKIYGKMNKIDMGIAICHLCIATENAGQEFQFVIETPAPELAGYMYTGTVE
ncbi:MAG: nitroreductase family protein [Anaerovoracaceae bacterium]